MADYSEFATPASGWTQFVQEGNFRPPPSDLSLLDRRDYTNKARAALNKKVYGALTDGELDVTELSIPTSDGSSIDARLYRPSDSAGMTGGGLPLVVHLHSGGWHLGTLETEDPFCAYLCATLSRMRASGVAVLNVNYRHTPEHRFPTQLDDTYAALDLVTKDATSLGIDANRIILTGTSAGAQLSVASMIHDVQRRRDSRGGDLDLERRIIGLILTCPATVHPDLFPYHLLRSKEVCSYSQNANDPILPMERAKVFWDMFLPPSSEESGGAGDDNERNAAKRHPAISPLATEEDVFDAKLWPRVSFHVAGMDLLRDEALLFEEKLREKGVETSLRIYPGYPHGFNILPHLGETEKWREEMLKDLDAMLGN